MSALGQKRKSRRNQISGTIPTKCRSIYGSVEQVHEVPKSLSARIIVDLYPRASFGPASLLQGQGDVAKWTPAAGIEQV
jgi:hypothetical protein